MILRRGLAASRSLPFAAACGNADLGRLGLVTSQASVPLLSRLTLSLPTDAGVASAAAGGVHSLLLLDDGRVYQCGVDDGDGGATTLPRHVASLPPNVVSVSAGAYHSAAVTACGELWTWGRNERGQLGVATPGGAPGPPARVPHLSGVAAASCGLHHTLAVGAAGEAWAFGSRDLCGLGAEPWAARLGAAGASPPRLIRGLRGATAVSVSAGHSHSLVLDSLGFVHVFGQNTFYQLGNGSDRPVLTPVRLEDVPPLACVAAGGAHSLAAGRDGAAWAWGANQSGCLGVGNSGGARVPSPVVDADKPGGNEASSSAGGGGFGFVAVSAGWKHSAGLTGGGRLWAWGWGGSQGEGRFSSGGQLGLGDEVDYWVPQRVGMAGVKAVSCGWNHTLVVCAGGYDA